MSFLDKIKAKIASASSDLGASVVKLAGKLGVHPSDAQLTDAERKADAFAAGVTALAQDYIDGIPGVPTVAAQLVAHQAQLLIDAVIAGAIEGAKKANG